MATFQYEAKDKNNEIVRGTLEVNSAGEAIQAINKKGLTLRRMSQVEGQIADLKRSMLDVMPQDTNHEVTVDQPVEEEATAVLIQEVKEELFVEREPAEQKLDMFAPEPETSLDRAHIIADQRKQVSINETEIESSEESLIFSRKPKSLPRMVVANDDILAVQDDIVLLLKNKGLSENTKGQLQHLESVLEELQMSQNKKRWKNFKKRFKEVKRTAEREAEHFESQQWDELQRESKKVESYTDFDDIKTTPERVIQKIKREPSRIAKWLRIIDQPIESDEKEVLIKQHYESAWAELQRFSGALLAFYLVVYMTSYYLKRNGIDDNFLVRIYNTTLFKQLVYGLFSLFVLLTVRQILPRKRINTDALFIIVWVALLWAVYF